ncbi:hypothetical protein [Pectobacterium polaris]|uniref:Uncharacterized protein n=1 Tax=Pectobacterium polaris TaxID=2042057 RepID=A0AAQ0WWQ9_9GAMM|nr:hypothetical protein [Pectobacterium polaris]ASY82331.1 hypothetical protein BJK05_21045 [Pectobacterium polaris]MBW5892612.1 hypothetical protein [Pectobacterium polaris]MCA6939602.1 hypothetical protein [Pectobacterium polaris]MCA6955831.1 hypothetical protein [Pectobacterium polaris]MCL6360583.1 hypothetical protein [Pectobacterium polaris]
MAKITQFVGTSATAGKTLPASWQLFSFGSMDKCGTITVNSISDFNANITIDVNIHSVPFNTTLDINLLDKDPNSKKGDASISFDGGPVEKINYHEGKANNPRNYPGGNALFLDNIKYQDNNVNIQLWPAKDKTLFYVKIPLISFWLMAG